MIHLFNKTKTPVRMWTHVCPVMQLPIPVRAIACPFCDGTMSSTDQKLIIHEPTQRPSDSEVLS